VSFVAVGGRTLNAGPAGSSADPNAYFNALIARSDLFKAYSLRDQQQLVTYKAAGSRQPWVTYDPAHDSYPKRQDAAKVVIPPFVPATSLIAPVAQGDTTITVYEANPSALSQFVRNAQVKIGGEIMNITARSGNLLTVTRGYLGTTAAAHAVGSSVALANNSLPNQVWLPVGTQDGHTYLATWDAWYGNELRRSVSGLKNWKTFQFDARKRQGGDAGIWFEVRTRFDIAPTSNDVAQVDARGYSRPFGPNVTRDQPLAPQVGTFVIKPETWVRYWVLIEQNASDWDLMSLWVADENHDPVKIIDRLQFENYGLIEKFRLEFNTSTYSLTVNRGDVVAYVRNWVMLRDPANPTSIMQRPFAGLPLPPQSLPPAAPTGLHVVPSSR
jgi:hypothetical protein